MDLVCWSCYTLAVVWLLISHADAASEPQQPIDSPQKLGLMRRLGSFREELLTSKQCSYWRAVYKVLFCQHEIKSFRA